MTFAFTSARAAGVANRRNTAETSPPVNVAPSTNQTRCERPTQVPVAAASFTSPPPIPPRFHAGKRNASRSTEAPRPDKTATKPR